jgi:immune inhibitor A
VNKRKHTRWLAVILIALLIAGPVAAQGGGDSARTLRILEDIDIPVRDVADLAERLGGIAGASSIMADPAPNYDVGDRETFFVGNGDENTISEIEAVLAAEAEGVYLWVQDGVGFDSDTLADIAVQLDEQLFPAVRALYGQEPSPGVDGDSHIYILNVTDVGASVGGYFNDNSTYPREVFASSNERELFVIAVDNVPFESLAYLYVLAHEFVHLIQHNEDENEETWVAEGTAELGAFLTVGPRPFAVEQYLANPTIQLNTWDIDDPTPHYGAASLFFAYLIERFGEDFVLAHSQNPADGITGVSHTLLEVEAVDPLTGEAITFADVFADWLAANLIKDAQVDDGRYGYANLPLTGSRVALTATASQYPAALQNQQVNQHGAHYIGLTSETPAEMAITFTGSDQVRVIPTDAYSGSHVYWANRSDQSNPRLTRAFDLSAVESATLVFQTWYEMEPFWDYGYLSVSTDGGASWSVLENSATTDENPNNRAFTSGITGFSVGGTGSRPAPFMGISYDPASGTITGLVPESGADLAGLLPGDRLLAIDTEAVQPERLAEQLQRYEVDDRIQVTVIRAGERLDLPLVLGAHPDRTLRPNAAWMEQRVDLTPYVGGEVLVRFEYVTDQAFTRNGWVLDDIAVPEIGYLDDAESDAGGWTAEGWARIENLLPQEYVLQIVTTTGGTPAVERLLMPGDGVNGTWTVPVGPEEPAILIISGMTRYTTQAATYDLTVEVVE